MCICFYLSINLSTKLLSKESDNMFYPANSCFFIFLFLKMDCKYQYKQYRLRDITSINLGCILNAGMVVLNHIYLTLCTKR